MRLLMLVQLEVLKRNVDRTATDLESVRAQIKQIKKDITSKQMRSSNLSTVSSLSRYLVYLSP